MDVVRSWAYRFTAITITQKPRNNVQYVDTLAYFVAAIKADSPRMIAIKFHPKSSIEISIEQFRGWYDSTTIFWGSIMTRHSR